ncbi:DNA mismatch repair protein, putative [Plasmodium sp. gorilla clade G2]|uniref:DNA mismatch repair protein, putative n=1 Tax=Plasmodium sp. gorilla clade G2 TaxID=880535 RepID=UPI000D222530|nr:DNA mismatch repair protein, putative [Plasmodium sp. gorilla clade G2]SOV18620.1 DNA mismatch repair protein, putative [Plasmodium sp. gorilla clade G2]
MFFMWLYKYKVYMFVMFFFVLVENTMSMKKNLMFTYFNKKKFIYIKKNVLFLNNKYISNLVYTKEDDIYKINEISNVIGRNRKKKNRNINNDEDNDNNGNKNELDDNIISSNRYINNLFFTNNKNISPDIRNNNNEDSHDNNNNNNILDTSYNHDKYNMSDNELQLYKNKCKIPLYWIKKLDNLKNMNAINCIEYLKDDNLLYFDNYKNKGLLKFLNDEKRKYSNCIILSRVGDFYETYGLDSIFLIEFLNIKKMNNRLSCGFIKSSINKALNILTNNNLNVCIYEEINEKSLKMKKRYLSQIVTPEFPIYLNNIQYYNKDEDIQPNKNNNNNNNIINNNNNNNCSSYNNMDKCLDSSNLSALSFFNSYDLDDYFVIKEIVCIYIESKNIFSLSKINLSLKTISIYDNITFDVLNVYLKNTNFLKVYIHQHTNTSFTKKITELFKIENYYLFNNFKSSFYFHMFILDKLKKQIHVKGLFRLIKNKNVFKIESADCKKEEKSMQKQISNYMNYKQNNKINHRLINNVNNNIDDNEKDTINNNNNNNNNNNDVEENIDVEINKNEEDNNIDKIKNKNIIDNNFEYSFSSYCTPLNIFTSYNMGIYKQNNHYENKNNFLFYNIIDINNNNSNSINISESLEFFKNIFLFYPPFEVTKHIRYINEYIKNNMKDLIIPNIKPFKNNIIISLLSNLKADHHILKKILVNIDAVLNCIRNYDFSLLVSIFKVLNHQNSFKLHIIKFYKLLMNIQKIMKDNLDLGLCSKFSYQSDIQAFNDFVIYHEMDVYNIINENLLIEENKELENSRTDLLNTIISNYSEYDRTKNGDKDINLLNKMIKIDNANDIIGIKKNINKKKKNEQISEFFHPLNKKSDVMKNVYVTQEVQNKIKIYLFSIYKKKKKINEIIHNINIQLSSSVHILSFVSNFLQIIQALYNHTVNSLKKGWSLPICKHLHLSYENVSFNNIDDKLGYIQKKVYNDIDEIKEDTLTKNVNTNDSSNNFINDQKNTKEFVKLSLCDEERILENVDKDSVEEIKKMYKEKNYVNDSITYIMGAKPYNVIKHNLIKYDFFLKKKNFILLTGKNMSGKTTLSFTILSILFLSNLGMYAPCDEKSIIGKFREFYSLKNVNYQEQIENMSLFREQAYYINSIIEEIKENYSIDKRPTREKEIFIVLDEPCIATTPVDNAIIISAVSDYLKNYCGIIITHNYDLLNKICQSKNIVFKRINKDINYLKEQDNKIVGKLEDGICKNSEALETCRYTNIDPHVLNLLNEYEKKYKFIHNLSNTLYTKFLEYIQYRKDGKCLNDFFDQYINDIIKQKSDKHEIQYNTPSNMENNYNNSYISNHQKHYISENQKYDNNYDMDFIKDKELNNIINSNNNIQEFLNNYDKTRIYNENLNNNNLEQYDNSIIYDNKLNVIIKKIEEASNKKVIKIGMNEEVPIYYKNKSIVYILCIFSKNENDPYFYIGISDNISERIKCHTRNLLNNKNLLKNPKKNNLLNYKYDWTKFYILLFHVDNKMIASKYEKELSNLLKDNYNILSK